MRRIALAALVLAPVLAGGCVFAVGNGDLSDDRRLKRLEQRMAAAEKKLNMDQAKAPEAPKTPETPKPPEEPKKP
jgi:hypothetical protein